MSRAIHYDDLPDGTVLRHAPCGEFYTVGVDEFWDAAEKPRCERCEVEDGDPYAGWHVATWVEAEFPELFDQGYAKLPDELWDYGHRLPLSSAELLVVGALWRHQSRGGLAHPDYELLARETGLSKRTIGRTTTGLAARGLLGVKGARYRRSGVRQANDYDLRPLWRAVREAVHQRPSWPSANGHSGLQPTATMAYQEELQQGEQGKKSPSGNAERSAPDSASPLGEQFDTASWDERLAARESF